MTRARLAAALTVAVGLGFSSGCCHFWNHDWFGHHGDGCCTPTCGGSCYEGDGILSDGPALDGCCPGSGCQGGAPMAAPPGMVPNTMPPLSPTPRLVPQPQAQPIPYAPPR